MVEITAPETERETPKAVLVRDVWLPKSRINVVEQSNGGVRIQLPAWLAGAKGIDGPAG